MKVAGSEASLSADQAVGPTTQSDHWSSSSLKIKTFKKCIQWIGTFLFYFIVNLEVTIDNGNDDMINAN